MSKNRIAKIGKINELNMFENEEEGKGLKKWDFRILICIYKWLL